MSKLSLSVEALPKVKPPAIRASATVALGPADLRDQRWLDERIERIEDGIEAVLDIARNWSDAMNLSRLHPGVSAQDYILGRVKSPLGRGVVVPLLAESNWSNRQIAAIAGVDHTTVGRIAARTGASAPVDRPTETLGADGKLRPVTEVHSEEGGSRIDDALWDALMATIDAISGLAGHDASSVAANVPSRRRVATAKRLRKLGTYLGRIAWALEGNEGDS